MTKKPDLISALPPLSPESIVNIRTGELVAQADFDIALGKLASFVQEQSKRLWDYHKDTLKYKLEIITATAPSEVGRQVGLSVELNKLPRNVKAKSRIERLVRYQTITNAKSYYKSNVATKQEPSFTPYLNLGAVDAQMAVITLIANTIRLSFKCWEDEYLLTFRVPDYVLARNVEKITLPIIKQRNNGWGFIFTAHERSGIPTINDEYVIGVDLGRVEPYTLAVVHTKTGSMVAHYTASPRLRQLAAKRDRINKELGYLYAKSKTHESLGLTREFLELERVRTRAKRNRIMNKITWLIATEVEIVAAKYSPRFVALENLTWVSSKKGMSRWTHSKDQTAIIHKLTRSGMVTRKVSPKDTSQDCHKCGAKVTHKPGKRLVLCSSCGLTIDRDINAAINIALRPLLKRRKGK
jgi:hypothetical protein